VLTFKLSHKHTVRMRNAFAKLQSQNAISNKFCNWASKEKARHNGKK